MAGQNGPISVSAFIDLALYSEPGGFYTDEGSAGRSGRDFITSPEVGPLFGQLIGRWLDRQWDALGRPVAFNVVEVGAGPGTLARTIAAGQPECSRAMQYHAVERSAAQRGRHPGGIASYSELSELDPAGGPSVLIANELFDNVAFDLLERTATGWAEVRIAPGEDSGWREVLAPASAETVASAERLVPEAKVGARVPDQRRAAALLGSMRSQLEPQASLIIDYAVATTAELASRPQEQWLRTYAHQQRGDHFLQRPGEQDITVDVCLDQLLDGAPASIIATQADFLKDLGIDELVAEGDAIWAERAAIGDLAAVKARSRRREAEALCESTGLGRFTVVEWPATPS